MNKPLTLLQSIALVFLIFLLQGCFIDSIENSSRSRETVQGYRPVYGSPDGGEIKFVASHEVKNPGKIYVYGQYLLINEINQGIHVYDNHDPENPEALGFIQLVGNSDMAVKNNVLYADHMGNIVALYIQDFDNLTTQASLPLQNWNYGVPPPSGSYFECVESEKGIVVSWKKIELKNPSCYANY
jgi:hypothetical protein